MSLFKHLRRFFRLPPPGGTRTFTLDAELQQSLAALAEQEQRSPQDVAARLIHAALSQRQLDAQCWQRWRTLSARQQEIAALVCLNYTSPQIAVRLGIAETTIKTHVRHILGKFDASSRQELRQALADWDFSAWE